MLVLRRRRGAIRLVVAAAAGAVFIGLTAAAWPSWRVRRHVVRIAHFEFAPAELRVAPGDTVEWRNADFLRHTTAADSGKWSSTELAMDSSFVFVAGDTGSFPYHCNAHPSMRAVLIVR